MKKTIRPAVGRPRQGVVKRSVTLPPTAWSAVDTASEAWHSSGSAALARIVLEWEQARKAHQK